MKQINLQSPLLKEFLKYLGWILLFAVLWFRGCSSTPATPKLTKVIVPEVKGKFEVKKPVSVKIESFSRHREDDKNIYIENEIDQKLITENEKLKQDFAKEKDSLKRIIAYNKAVQLNKFSSDFEDDNILINIEGIVQGEVKEITPGYKIKEKKVEVLVKPKETVFRLLGGMELGNNTKLDGFAAKANLMLQNKKGNIISGSFDTNQTIWIGYNFSIFDIKR